MLLARAGRQSDSTGAFRRACEAYRGLCDTRRRPRDAHRRPRETYSSLSDAHPGPSDACPRLSDAHPRVSGACRRSSDAHPKPGDAPRSLSDAHRPACDASPSASDAHPSFADALPSLADARPSPSPKQLEARTGSEKSRNVRSRSASSGGLRVEEVPRTSGGVPWRARGAPPGPEGPRCSECRCPRRATVRGTSSPGSTPCSRGYPVSP